VFNQLDRHMWMLTYKWAKRSHPHKSKHWIISRYFGAFHPDRRDRRVFGDRDSGAYLLKFAWTKITPARPRPWRWCTSSSLVSGVAS
jgi:RNA-directed DNA polymerase